MILSFMLYILLVSLLLATGARVLEEVIRGTRFPVRFLWISMLLLTFAMAVAAPFRTSPSPDFTTPGVVSVPDGSEDAGVDAYGLSSLSGWTVDTIRQIRDWPMTLLTSRVSEEGEQVAGTVWLLLTFILLTVGTITFGRYHFLRKSWPTVKISGYQARLAPNAGPAVVGLIHPEIVVPEWLLDSPDDERKLVVLHELEHLRSRDPVVLILGCLIVALIPWNPVVWWMLYRLRLCVELDCDKRVLNKGAKPELYGTMMLDVAGRNSGLIYGVPAFSGSPSILKKRLLAMTTQNKRTPTTLTVMFTAISAALLFFACDSTMITDSDVIEELHATAVEREDAGETLSIRDTTGNDKQPLIFIDGVRLEEGESISDLNPKDIESINVIKDASAAIYGPEAEDGVILITLRSDVETEDDVEIEVLKP